jgi:hypothetical protein
LPYWENAHIDPAKLKDWALKPDTPKGKGFARVLGIGLEDWDWLRTEILSALPHAEATEFDDRDPAIPRFRVDIPLTGPTGRNGLVVTGWHFAQSKDADGNPRPQLSTCYAKPDPRR